MASSRARKAGYNPAAGFPEPGDPRNDGRETHAPHSNGTICGKAITDASAYTVERPTCETCARHYDALQRQAARMGAQQKTIDDRAAAAAPEQK